MKARDLISRLATLDPGTEVMIGVWWGPGSPTMERFHIVEVRISGDQRSALQACIMADEPKYAAPRRHGEDTGLLGKVFGTAKDSG